MARGSVRLASPDESRNGHQSVTLMEAIDEHRFDALIGGARRDEEKARAKERILSHRDSFGQWQPKNQRPELWTLFNTRLKPGEHMRVVSDQQLDRARRLALHPARADRPAEPVLHAPARSRSPPRPARSGDRGDAAGAARDASRRSRCAFAPSAT